MASARDRLIRARLHRPVGKQAEVVALRETGHHVILGTAGSGKTTMAMYRAVYLSDPRADHAGRTLLVVFNSSLLAWLKQGILPGDPNLDVITYHRFALRYLKYARGIKTDNAICPNEKRTPLIERARRETSKTIAAALARSTAFFAAEIAWMARHGIRDERQYLEADRVGRLRPLRRNGQIRRAAWSIRERYLALREADQYLFDWDDIAIRMNDELALDGTRRHYRHIIVDEAQDFSLEMLRSLVGSVDPDHGTLTVFGDSAQQIYGHGIPWKQAGMDVRQGVWEFKHNYRNSPQIAKLAQAIAAMPYYDGVEDMVLPDKFADEGPPPGLKRFATYQEEAEWVLARAKATGRTGSTAVLFSRRSDRDEFLKRCRKATSLDRDTFVWSTEPGIWAGTVNSAKGFEFDTVILSRLNADRWPEPMKIEDVGEAEASAADGKRLYVGVTRARTTLLMTTVGAPTSLLPVNDDLWVDA